MNKFHCFDTDVNCMSEITGNRRKISVKRSSLQAMRSAADEFEDEGPEVELAFTFPVSVGLMNVRILSLVSVSKAVVTVSGDIEVSGEPPTRGSMRIEKRTKTEGCRILLAPL